jgi:hypothetical protein
MSNNEVIIIHHSTKEERRDEAEEDVEIKPCQTTEQDDLSSTSSTPKKQRSLLKLLSSTASALPKHKSRVKRDEKVVGLKHYGLENPARHQLHDSSFETSYRKDANARGVRFAVEAKEEEVRRKETRNSFAICYFGNLAALKVMIYYLSESTMKAHDA